MSKVALVLGKLDFQPGTDLHHPQMMRLRHSIVPAYEAEAIVLEFEEGRFRFLKHRDSTFLEGVFTEEAVRWALKRDDLIAKTLDEMVRDLKVLGRL
jgi:hypothetical protein